MPHTLLECSANVTEAPDLQGFWTRLHAHLAATAPCRLEDIKSRATRCPEFRVGAGDALGFVHLSIRLLEGRDPATLARIGEGALGLLQATFPQALASGRCDLTVELIGMRRDSYFKASPG